MSAVVAGGEPFYFAGGQTGCLLIHGFTGATKEMRGLGEHLAGQGFSVLGVRLFGHSTQPADLRRVRWTDWMADVEGGYHLLRGRCDAVVGMGLSMGGALALLAAARLPLAGAVSMSTPYFLPDRRAARLRPVLPLLGLIVPSLPKGPPDWHDSQAAADHLEYPTYTLRAVAELDDLLAEMRRALSAVTVPVLIMTSEGDRSVPPDHAEAIRRGLGTRDVELLRLLDSGHVITREPERDRVFAAAAAFVRRVAPAIA